MSTSETSTGVVQPSEELLGEAARRVAEAYPGLYAHQRTGVAFLLARRRAILADDMGLGKTRQAIIAVARGRAGRPVPRHLPGRGEAELAARDRPRRGRGRRAGAARARTRSTRRRRWTVVNYDILGRFEDRFARRRVGRRDRRRGALHQERVAARSAGAAAGRRARRSAIPQAVYLLTGTPMTSRPRDLFNLLRAVGHPLGRSFYSYAKRYCAAVDNGYGLDTPRRIECRGAREGRLRRDAAPGEVRGARPAAEDADLAAGRGGREAVPAAGGPGARVLRGASRAGRPDLGDASSACSRRRGRRSRWRRSPHTLEAVRERVEAGEKVVVFSSFTEPIEKLKAELGDTAVVITGKTTQKKRADGRGGVPERRPTSASCSATSRRPASGST